MRCAEYNWSPVRQLSGPEGVCGVQSTTGVRIGSLVGQKVCAVCRVQLESG